MFTIGSTVSPNLPKSTQIHQTISGCRKSPVRCSSVVIFYPTIGGRWARLLFWQLCIYSGTPPNQTPSIPEFSLNRTYDHVPNILLYKHIIVYPSRPELLYSVIRTTFQVPKRHFSVKITPANRKPCHRSGFHYQKNTLWCQCQSGFKITLCLHSKTYRRLVPCLMLHHTGSRGSAVCVAERNNTTGNQSSQIQACNALSGTFKVKVSIHATQIGYIVGKQSSSQGA